MARLFCSLHSRRGSANATVLCNSVRFHQAQNIALFKSRRWCADRTTQQQQRVLRHVSGQSPWPAGHYRIKGLLR